MRYTQGRPPVPGGRAGWDKPMERQDETTIAEIKVNAADMMAARERRAERQRSLLEQGGALVSFTLNVPGPVKRSPRWERAFDEAAA